jgi:hypothetical protein
MWLIRVFFLRVVQNHKPLYTASIVPRLRYRQAVRAYCSL